MYQDVVENFLTEFFGFFLQSKFQLFYYAREVIRYMLRLKKIENIISWTSKYEISKQIRK